MVIRRREDEVGKREDSRRKARVVARRGRFFVIGMEE